MNVFSDSTLTFCTCVQFDRLRSEMLKTKQEDTGQRFNYRVRILNWVNGVVIAHWSVEVLVSSLTVQGQRCQHKAGGH